MTPLGILRDLLIGGVRVGRDDVPSVEEARKIGKTAEREVDQTVGRADSALHPHGDGWEEDGDDAEEDVASAHVEVVRVARVYRRWRGRVLVVELQMRLLI